MLAPSCLTSLDRRKTNTKHTVESRRKISQRLQLPYIVSGALSNTLDMCKDHCTVADLCMICYTARTSLPKSTTPVVPLYYFGRNAKKWAVLKSPSKKSV